VIFFLHISHATGMEQTAPFPTACARALEMVRLSTAQPAVTLRLSEKGPTDE